MANNTVTSAMTRAIFPPSIHTSCSDSLEGEAPAKPLAPLWSPPAGRGTIFPPRKREGKVGLLASAHQEVRPPPS